MRHHLGASDVNGIDDIAFHERSCSVEAIINEHEAAGLFAVAPDFDFMTSGELRHDHFSADRCGGLFAAAIEGAVGTVDIVVARHSRFETEVFAEMSAHPLAEELFPTIAVFGIGRVSVFFLQAWNIGTLLLEAGVDTR